MRRMFTLLALFLLALGFLGGYLYLTQLIDAGNLKIVAGQKQLEEGEQMLARGKAKLANGEQRLSQGKQIRNAIRSVPLIGGFSPTVMVAATVGGKITSSKVSEGEQLINQGKQKIKAGEGQLAQGKLELAHGIKRLDQAKMIRTISGIATIFFTGLFILLGLYWLIERYKKRSR